MFKLPHICTDFTLAKKCSKFSKPGFNSTWIMKFQVFHLDLERAEETEIKLPTSVGSLEKKENTRKHLLLLYWLWQCLWLCQFSAVAQWHPTLCNPMDCSTPGFPVHRQLPELTQTHVHRVGDAIQPSHPLLSPSSPSNEYAGLISFKIDWFDLLEVQGTTKNLVQHHSSKASILQHSAFFRVQLTSIHDYWKNHSFD